MQSKPARYLYKNKVDQMTCITLSTRGWFNPKDTQDDNDWSILIPARIPFHAELRKVAIYIYYP